MQKTIMFILTLMLSGRMMTLAFIHRAGGDGAGDPPIAWLMPLIGDAVIGLSGLLVAWAILKARGLWVWTVIVIWNAVAIWDALSAYIISRTNPWPEFFMIQMMGSAMFFAAAALHLVILWLAVEASGRRMFLTPTEQGARH